MRLAERISSLVILGMCALFYTQSLRFSRYSALFPRVVIMILAFLAILLFILTFFRKSDQSFRKTEDSLQSLIALALMAAWVFVINVLGFAITSFLFFSAMSIFLDERSRSGWRLVRRLGFIAVTVGAFYAFFAFFLWVPFPEGMLF